MTFMDVYHYLGDRTVPLLKGGALAWFRNILFNPDRQINQGDHGDFGAIITAFLLSNGAFLVLRFPLDDTTKAVDGTTNSGFAFRVRFRPVEDGDDSVDLVLGQQVTKTRLQV